MALTVVVVLAGAWIAGVDPLGTVVIIMLMSRPTRFRRCDLSAIRCGRPSASRSARRRHRHVGVALHYNDVDGGLTAFSPATLAVMAAFFFGFGLVIAIYKDIPDLMGDRAYGIETFTVKLGPKLAFNLGRINTYYRLRWRDGGGDLPSAAARQLVSVWRRRQSRWACVGWPARRRSEPESPRSPVSTCFCGAFSTPSMSF